MPASEPQRPAVVPMRKDVAPRVAVNSEEDKDPLLFLEGPPELARRRVDGGGPCCRKRICRWVVLVFVASLLALVAAKLLHCTCIVRDINMSMGKQKQMEVDEMCR
jgi:hypothetical protein